MKKREIRQELKLLEDKEYRNHKERVFDFLALFKKSNTLKWCDEDGLELKIVKKGEQFIYKTLIFSVNDEDKMKVIYCAYQKAKLTKMLELVKEGLNPLEGEQLALF